MYTSTCGAPAASCAHALWCVPEIVDRVPGVNPKRVCVHCFTGDISELQAYVARGFYVGFTGCICDDKRGKILRELVAVVPLAQTMIETDAPFMMPTGMHVQPKAMHPRTNARMHTSILPRA